MAEIKNLFLGAKMNKDLTPRLVSNREYIDARNAAIINSESGESGQLQNVLGNVIETDFGLTDKGLEIIGFYIDTSKDRLFCFITNWNDTSASGLDNFAASTREILGLTFVGSSHYICMYDVNKAQGSVLVSGEFLNFSKTKPVLGINLLEDLLFFTDDRNQPRKIDIKKALETPGYYSNEDNISVAKYYPWQPPMLASNSPIGSLLDNSPMRVTQQPTKIFQNLGNNGIFLGAFANELAPGVASGGQFAIYTEGDEVIAATVYATNYPTYTTGEGFAAGQEITITPEELGKTFNPDKPGSQVMEGNIKLLVRDGNLFKDSTMKDVTSEGLPGMQYWEAIGVDNESFTIADPKFGPANYNQLDNWIGTYIVADNITLASKTKITGVTAGTPDANRPSQPFTITYSPASTAPISGEVLIGANPYYDANFKGDSEYLSDKFVRFSYRFKYDNDEYSLAAPFTQAAFIPKQDGYFLDKQNATGGGPTSINDDAAESDEVNAVQSTIVSFMENKVNTVGIVITMPEGVSTVSALPDDLHVKEIDILYKESDQVAIKVVNTITTEELRAITDTNRITYNYTSQAPIKTLPSNETSRASDKVPIRAKAQEVAGNRVMYGNYLVRTARPKTLGYSISLGEKAKLGQFGSYSEIEYPNHVLKQNRSYTLGVVLSDRYGRQSDVILSEFATGYNKYNVANTEFISGQGERPNVYRGSSIKALWDKLIPSEISSPGYAGLYSSENPLGWYSYKLVVQQKEQEYYNVYLPSILNNSPQTTAVTSNSVAFITLFSDNINKVPRDLNEVGPNQVQFSSSERLFGRVTNSIYKEKQSNSFQFIPSTTPDKVVSIGLRDETGLDKDVDGNPYDESPFYGMPKLDAVGRNPLIGRISTQKAIGAIGGFEPATSTIPVDSDFPITFKNTTLNVYETAPTRSEIDIFYETSTSGLISELNTDIKFGDAGLKAVAIENWSFNLNESTEGGTTLNTPGSSFIVKNYQDLDIQGVSGVTVTAKIVSVFSGNDVDITGSNLFELAANGTSGWHIKTSTNASFVYTSNSSVNDRYKFTIEFAVAQSGVTEVLKSNVTVNASKSILKNSPPISYTGDNSVSNKQNITQYTNGMNSSLNRGNRITRSGTTTFWGTYDFQLPIEDSAGFIDTGFSFDFRNGAFSNLLYKQGLSIVIKSVYIKLPRLFPGNPWFYDSRKAASEYARLSFNPETETSPLKESLQINVDNVKVFNPTVMSLEERTESDYNFTTLEWEYTKFPGLYTPNQNPQDPSIQTEYLITIEVFDAASSSIVTTPLTNTPTVVTSPGVGSKKIEDFSFILRVNNP